MSNERQRRSNPLLSKQERLNLERFLYMTLKQVVLEIYFFCIFVIVEVQGIYETILNYSSNPFTRTLRYVSCGQA